MEKGNLGSMEKGAETLCSSMAILRGAEPICGLTCVFLCCSTLYYLFFTKLASDNLERTQHMPRLSYICWPGARAVIVAIV